MSERTRKMGKYMLLLLMLALFWGFPMSASAAKAAKPAKPVLKSAKASEGKITVSWKKSAGASEYWIYRKESGGKYYLIAARKAKKGCSYADTEVLPARSYTYTVIAVTGSGSKQKKSSYDKAGVSATAKIPRVKLSGISKGNSSLTVKWKRMDGVSGYRVYRKTGSGKFRKVAEMKASDVKYKDSDVEAGKFYSYTVRALVEDVDGVHMGSYDQKGLKAQAPVKKAALRDVATASGRMLVSWKTVSEVDGYMIYRRESGDKDWSKVMSTANATKNFWWDDSARPGKSYFYGIYAYVVASGKKVKSELSESEKAVRCLPASPILLSVKQSGTKDIITWKSSPGAAGYVVYKKSSETKDTWEEAAKVKKGVTEAKVKRDEGVTTTYTVRAWVKNGDKTYYSSYKDTLTNAEWKYTKSNVLFDGDSITWGRCWDAVSATKVTYPERVAQLTGIQYKNTAISGCTVTRRSSTENTSMVARAESGKSKYAGYSVICLAGGTNDYRANIPIGTAASMDDHTFNGALNIIFQQIRQQNPTAKVVVITPIYRGVVGADYTKIGLDCENDLGYTLKDYSKALKEAAERAGACVYDSADYDIVNKDNYTSMTVDALHPTEEAYCKIGKSIASFLKKTVLQKDS